jgi:DNA-binding winged helix-turn-helix (wHTH) protein/Tol biopolymer transport system component
MHMGEAARAEETIRFGVFEVDLRSGELRKAGVRIKLQEQPFKVLNALLEHPGEVVTREELRSRIWPDESSGDFDHAVNIAVAKLRTALGDSADAPHLIETLHRRGYRFIFPLPDRSLTAQTVAVLQPATAPASPEQPLRKTKRWYASVIALLGLAALIGALWFIVIPYKAPEPSLTAIPVTSYPGSQFEPSFSPDGNQVAFAWNGPKQDNFDIYVKLIGTSGPPFRLTTDALPDHSPAWSPDGRFIAFIREPRERSAVIIIPALGGPERKIADISKIREEIPGPSLTWSPDGNSLVISDRDSLTSPYALFLLSIETGEKHRLTSPPPLLVGDTSPAFSPDGHTLAFSRRVDFDYTLGDLYVLNLLATSEGLKPAGQEKRVTFENRGARSPAWTSDGREIVFADQISLARISPSVSTQPRRITSFGDNNVDTLAISRHGHAGQGSGGGIGEWAANRSAMWIRCGHATSVVE